jgi:hypothetical protein
MILLAVTAGLLLFACGLGLTCEIMDKEMRRADDSELP